MKFVTRAPFFMEQFSDYIFLVYCANWWWPSSFCQRFNLR